MRLIAVQLNPTIGDLEGNSRKIIDALRRAQSQKCDLVLFSEMTISGYCPEDLLLNRSFVDSCIEKLEGIAPETKGMFVAVGLPRWNPSGKEKPLYNSAAIFIDGKLSGFKNKTLLPTYDIFDERRYFEPDEEQPIFEYRGKRIGVTICEDIWQHGGKVNETHYRCDPVLILKEKKPDLLLNLSGSPYYYKRGDVRLSAFQAVARTLRCPVLFCNQVGANDSIVFDGHSFYLDQDGGLRQVAKGFVEEDLVVESEAPNASCPVPENGIKELYSALVLGVSDYFRKQGFGKALVGLSGGVDSALVACIAKDALGSENVIGITLPSRFSSAGSVDDSAKLAKKLGIDLLNIPIETIYKEYLHLLEPYFHGRGANETEENLQTRIRGMILMAFSNKFGALLLNTGNKSEMAMGYCTLYGDMAGGLAVLQDVAKLHVYQLAKHIGIPESILNKVPSAELRENQTDFDTLPPFEILDPIIEDYIEEGLEVEAIAKKRKQTVSFVRSLIHRIHLAEYKRRQAPIGIRVTQKAFSKGRVVPIVQKWL